jgi:hypothetical protein
LFLNTPPPPSCYLHSESRVILELRVMSTAMSNGILDCGAY